MRENGKSLAFFIFRLIGLVIRKVEASSYGWGTFIWLSSFFEAIIRFSCCLLAIKSLTLSHLAHNEGRPSHLIPSNHASVLRSLGSAPVDSNGNFLRLLGGAEQIFIRNLVE